MSETVEETIEPRTSVTHDEHVEAGEQPAPRKRAVRKRVTAVEAAGPLDAGAAAPAPVAEEKPKRTRKTATSRAEKTAPTPEALQIESPGKSEGSPSEKADTATTRKPRAVRKPRATQETTASGAAARADAHDARESQEGRADTGAHDVRETRDTHEARETRESRGADEQDQGQNISVRRNGRVQNGSSYGEHQKTGSHNLRNNNNNNNNNNNQNKKNGRQQNGNQNGRTQYGNQGNRNQNGNQGSRNQSGSQGNRAQYSNQGNHGNRNRRNYSNQRDAGPQITREELEELKVADLRAKAEELGIEHKALKKPELVDAVLSAMIKAEGFVECSGILDLLSDGYGFLRTHGYLPGEGDVYVGVSTIRKHGLRKGDLVTGMVRPPSGNDKFPALNRIDTVNGLSAEESRNRCKFSELTPVYPDDRLIMEHGHNTITSRTIDLVAPIGKGQRGLIVSPPKAGKTTILKDIAASITANNPEVHLMCLLVDERPEEVTDMERSIKGEVVSSTFDMPSENHIAVAELVIERAKRLVEMGADVVILLDSITRLARAYNLAQPASGRVLSGGVDSTALYPPKRFLGAARNIEHGGSLTILASALIDTGSKMDEVIFEEFKGTGNMELKLDRGLADRRIFPAIDPIASGTRKEELLLDPQEAPLIWGVRRVLANAGSIERAMEMLIKSLKQTDDNKTFIMRAARKAQGRSGGALEL